MRQHHKTDIHRIWPKRPVANDTLPRQKKNNGKLLQDYQLKMT
jgi:hypothetical protein